MKTGSWKGKNMRMKMPASAPVSNAHFKRRKIPEKTRVSRRDEEQICGKERRSHAANLDALGEE